MENTIKNLGGNIQSLIDNLENQYVSYVSSGKILESNEKKDIEVGKNSKYSNNIGDKLFGGICVSTGGIRGLLLSGAINEFWIRGQLKSLKYYAGVSVGSLIVTCLAIGYSPVDILTVACSPIFSSQFQTLNFMNLPGLHGFYPNSILKSKIEELIMLKLGYLPTFKEFYETTGKYILIPNYCLSESDVSKRKIYCSVDTTPDMKLSDAIVLSCSIPLIFEKAKYKGNVYIDGGYADNFPVYEIEKIIRLKGGNEDILGIFLERSNADLDSLLGYITSIVMIPIHDQVVNNIPKNVDIIEIRENDKTISFKFNIGVTEKMNMFSCGNKQVKKLLDGLSKILSVPVAPVGVSSLISCGAALKTASLPVAQVQQVSDKEKKD